MRAFILALALVATPFTLIACQSEEADAVEDAAEEQADAIEEAGEAEADAIDEAIEDGAPAGDEADVIGDGEVFDEPGEPDANELGE